MCKNVTLNLHKNIPIENSQKRYAVARYGIYITSARQQAGMCYCGYYSSLLKRHAHIKIKYSDCNVSRDQKHASPILPTLHSAVAPPVSSKLH